MSIADHIHRTRRVYANHNRIIDLEQQYDNAADAVDRAVIAERVAFVIEHQIEHLAASRLARALTLLPLDRMQESRVDWLARGAQAWAEATANPKEKISGCPDCARGVFHNRHTTVAERDAEIADLAAKLRAARPVTPSTDERSSRD